MRLTTPMVGCSVSLMFVFATVLPDGQYHFDFPLAKIRERRVAHMLNFWEEKLRLIQEEIEHRRREGRWDLDDLMWFLELGLFEMSRLLHGSLCAVNAAFCGALNAWARLGARWSDRLERLASR